MGIRVIKRDGRDVEYNSEAIAKAILKSSKAINLEVSNLEKVINDIQDRITKDLITVEEIQDLVEKSLIENNNAAIAKAYILYRAKRTDIRERNTKLMGIFEDITFSASKNNNSKRENANINADSPMGMMLKYGTETAKQFNLAKLVREEHSLAHMNGDIHIHDLDFLSLTMTCTQIPLDKLFKHGFNTGHGHIRQPNDIRSYGALACIALQANQNDMHKQIYS